MPSSDEVFSELRRTLDEYHRKVRNLQQEVKTVRSGQVKELFRKWQKEQKARRGLEARISKFEAPKSIWETLKAKSPAFIAGAGAAAALYGGHRLSQYIKHRHEASRNFESMMNHTPTLKQENPELVRDRFNTLQRFAPTVAKDPLVAGSIVRHWVEFPTVTADALRSVTSVESDVRREPNLLSALGRLATGIGD